MTMQPVPDGVGASAAACQHDPGAAHEGSHSGHGERGTTVTCPWLISSTVCCDLARLFTNSAATPRQSGSTTLTHVALQASYGCAKGNRIVDDGAGEGESAGTGLSDRDASGAGLD